MNFINNQINTAMMKKLLFAGTAVLALSATAVQAETVTNGGVTYSYTLPDNIEWIESNDKESATLTTGTDAVSSGYLTVTGTFTTTKTATATINPTATAVAAASVDFSSWSDNTTFKGNRVQNNNTPVYVGDNVYNLEIQRIIKAGNVTLYTWDDVVTNNDANAIIGFYEDETAGWVDDDGTQTIDEKYTKDNTDDFESMYDGTYGFPDYNELYFSRVATTRTSKGKTTTTVRYYAIYKLVDQTTNNIDSTLTVSFEPTTIPAGVLNADVATLTIGSNITSIDDNAFENATGITYVAASGKYTAVNNMYLYYNNETTNETTLRYVAKNYQSESLKLSALTTSVGAYATIGLTSDKIIYYSYTNLSIGSNQGATFISKTPSITWASGNKQIYTASATSYVNATVLKDALESLEGSTACVDLRKAKLATDINLTANYGNIMVILPSNQGVSVGGINVIYSGADGYVCDDLELNDEYRTNGFYTPIGFIATEANYDRVFTSNNSTICLPFDLNYIPTGFTVGTPVETNSTEYCVNFAQAGGVQANKPFLIFTDGVSRSLTGLTNVSVKATTSQECVTSVLNHTIIGRLSPVTVAGNTGNIYAFKNNSLVRIGDEYTLTVNTFRCYLTSTSGNAAEIRYISEEELDTNAIEDLEAENDAEVEVYNLNGQKVNKKAAGFQILSNGTKKIIK
jgi:hypothetical protein